MDDLNAWVSFLNNFNDLRTPNLDKLARRSINFKNASAPATLCNPSRTAVITSKLPSNTGIYYNEEPSELFIRETKTPTIFSHFKSNNYHVIGAGKIFHIHHDIPEQFDDFYRPLRYFPDPKDATPWERSSGPASEHCDYMVADWTLKQFTRDFDKPFLISAGMFLPHHPWILPSKYFDYYPLDKIKIPETIPEDYDDIPVIARKRILRFLQLNSVMKQQNELKQMIQAYSAAVSFMDEQIGRILDALENSKYADNTVVVFWSDHGYHLGEKNTVRKMSLWEPATHVPFLVSVPGLGSKTYDKPISLVDMFPTLIELCHLPSIEGLDGESFADLIYGRSFKRNNPVITVQGPGDYAVKQNHWKYIRYADATEELYDLRWDPNEYKNLALNKSFEKTKNQLKNFLPAHPKKIMRNLPADMVWIPSGKYKNITIKDGFWMDKHEVTNEEFRKFVEKTGYKTDAERLTEPAPGSLVFSPPTEAVDTSSYLAWWSFVPDASWKDPLGDKQGIVNKLNHPVVQVSYRDAYVYCRALRKRLPREDEWNYAAANLANIPLTTNEKWNLNIFQGEFPHKNTLADGYERTAPVMSYIANQYGLFDMAGNVWEWVDGNGDEPGARNIKGGSFLCGDHCQGFNPAKSLPMKLDESTDHIGFRCVD